MSRGRTGEGAKRPVTRCSRLIAVWCAWCGVSWHRDDYVHIATSRLSFFYTGQT